MKRLTRIQQNDTGAVVVARRALDPRSSPSDNRSEEASSR